MTPPHFSDHDIDVLLAAVHHHALKKRVEPREAYDLQTKLLSLIGKKHPVTWEEVQLLARQVGR
jgi:hypothetical protein